MLKQALGGGGIARAVFLEPLRDRGGVVHTVIPLVVNEQTGKDPNTFPETSLRQVRCTRGLRQMRSSV
jgi:hypothetical protein